MMEGRIVRVDIAKPGTISWREYNTMTVRQAIGMVGILREQGFRVRARRVNIKGGK